MAVAPDFITVSPAKAIRSSGNTNIATMLQACRPTPYIAAFSDAHIPHPSGLACLSVWSVLPLIRSPFFRHFVPLKVEVPRGRRNPFATHQRRRQSKRFIFLFCSMNRLFVILTAHCCSTRLSQKKPTFSFFFVLSTAYNLLFRPRVIIAARLSPKKRQKEKKNLSYQPAY